MNTDLPMIVARCLSNINKAEICRQNHLKFSAPETTAPENPSKNGGGRKVTGREERQRDRASATQNSLISFLNATKSLFRSVFYTLQFPSSVLSRKHSEEQCPDLLKISNWFGLKMLHGWFEGQRGYRDLGNAHEGQARAAPGAWNKTRLSFCSMWEG